MDKNSVETLFDIRGKVALITGATGGLGKCAAEGLAQAGAKLMITGRSEDKLRKTAEELAAKNLEAACSAGDPAVEKDVDRVVADTVAKFGRIDILITAAGMNKPQPIVEQTADDWQNIMDANVRGTWLYCRAAGRVMIEKGIKGKVILISSTRGKLGMANYTAYCPSKAAVDLMAKSLACEWGKYQINVNAIGPTVFRTDLTQWMFDDDTARTKFLTRIPYGRLGEPEDFVGACIFLGSRASDFVTGTTLYVDGGYTAG